MSNGNTTAEAIAKIAGAIAAPAKLAFVGYVLLAVMEKIKPSACGFAIAAILFLAVSIWHDDYFRIRLNDMAVLKGAREHFDAGVNYRDKERLDSRA